MKILCGIQQIGIGVEAVDEAWEWYRKILGFDLPLFDDSGVAAAMLPYTGGESRERRALLAANLQGGGGLEIWQYLKRMPLRPRFTPRLGDLGIFAAKLKARNVEDSLRRLVADVPGPPRHTDRDPRGIEHFFMSDPFGNALQILPCPSFFGNTKAPVGGVLGALIGVSDMERSLRFYAEVLGYDSPVYDERGSFDDLPSLSGGTGRFRRVLVTRSAKPEGPFSELLGPSELELIQALDFRPRGLFEGRFWGDLGFIHLCFDVRGMAEFRLAAEAAGSPFTVDSNPESYAGGPDSFDMGDASGHFAYVEDPDGTLIELVETRRIPILKKLGWYLDLDKRQSAKPLPRWMLKALGLGRARG